MMKTLLGFLMLAVAASGADTTWRTLPLIANGKVSADWVQVGWGGFDVDGDALRTAPDGRGLGLLVYRKERFGNCQLRVVFKTSDAKANSGVYVRLADGILAQVGKPGAAFERDAARKISKASMELMKVSSEREEGSWYAVHHGYEVQIGDTGDSAHRTGAVYSLSKSSAPAKPKEWRTMIITLDDEKISVEVDGQNVSEFDPKTAEIAPRKKWPEPKREPKRPVIGYIGLQNHDPGELVWFREVSVRSLK